MAAEMRAGAREYVVTLSCENRPGIVAAVTTRLFELGGNIVDAQQFDDRLTNRFFLRMVFDRADACDESAALADAFAPLVARFGMRFRLRHRGDRPRVLILVSRFDHCLADLLYRQRIGELAMEVAGIVSNHPRETFAHLDLGDAPFRHIAVAPGEKAAAETALLSVIAESRADLVVLARYMQVLSDDLVTQLTGRCINIHHSFLPSFKGAKPYHQAHARGVKLIGATAHYVTGDLDEGPIIEQDVERISHLDTPEDLIRKGRDIERRVLARAIRYHLDHRVLLNGGTTVVFRD